MFWIANFCVRPATDSSIHKNKRSYSPAYIYIMFASEAKQNTFRPSRHSRVLGTTAPVDSGLARKMLHKLLRELTLIFSFVCVALRVSTACPSARSILRNGDFSNQTYSSGGSAEGVRGAVNLNVGVRFLLFIFL